MSHADAEYRFLRRFDALWSRMRRVQLGEAVCRAGLLLTLGLVLLMATDYWLELAWTARAVGLGMLAAVGFTLTARWIIRAMRSWNRPRTAGAVEERFPQLGQVVRTTVQYGGRDEGTVSAEGVAPTLATALEVDTDQRTRPLPLDLVVPTKRFRWAAVVTGAAVAALVMGILLDWEWRLAAGRALLGNRAYTRLAVSPGNIEVKEGEDVELQVKLHGRTDRAATLLTRLLNRENASWSERSLSANEPQQSGPRNRTYRTTLEDVTEPLEYRLTAGPVTSPIYRIDVRYPPAVGTIKVELTPPEYTGIEPETVDGGDLDVVEGTRARFHITLDREPASASLVLSSPHGRSADEVREQCVPLEIDGCSLTAELELTEDQTYSIVGRGQDGMEIAENQYRIRVRKDRPPVVWFEEPPVALEVHSLAEVLMRVRIRDDFGLAKAGIMFEINNEEEIPLLLKDLREASRQLETADGASPQAQAVLEKVLPLEHFELTQKDSVLYYAFAEDNRPNAAHRAMTDLRFIDIRPFRRFYRMSEPGMPGEGGGSRLVTLDELIARQRVALNRTVRLARKAAKKKPDLQKVDQLMGFEARLATATRELAAFLDGVGLDGADLLFQAEKSMLAAVDSLSIGRYETATLQEKDALRSLVEARNKVNISLCNCDAGLLAQLRRFDRMQAQKLRLPEQDEQAEEITRRLQDLADQEDFVYETLAGLIADSQGDGAGINEQPNQQDDSLAQPDEPPPADRKDSASESPSGGASREKIEERQIDIALQAHELERLLQELEAASALARSRMAEAARSADAVSSALARGSTGEAAQTAGQTAQEFRELSRHLRGLLQPEMARQIAAARDFSAELAERERSLAAEIDSQQRSDRSGNEASESDSPSDGQRKESDSAETENLQKHAAALAESGKTLQDLLEAILNSREPGSQDAVQRVGQIVEAEAVDRTVERMQDLLDALAAGRRQQARAEASKIARRLDVTAQELDELYRSLVSPRLQELMTLEKRAVRLQETLEALQTPMQIREWHADAAALVENLRRDSAALTAADRLMETIRAADGEIDAEWELGDDGLYLSPTGYRRSVTAVTEELQRQMQELVVDERLFAGDEPVPPQYKRLVERYFEVLTSGGGR